VTRKLRPFLLKPSGWIVDKGEVAHRRFIPGGKVNGTPNQAVNETDEWDFTCSAATRSLGLANSAGAL
jgi:hypothetical protein